MSSAEHLKGVRHSPVHLRPRQQLQQMPHRALHPVKKTRTGGMADQGCLEGADQVEALFYSFSFQLDFDSSEGIKCLSGFG